MLPARPGWGKAYARQSSTTWNGPDSTSLYNDGSHDLLNHPEWREPGSKPRWPLLPPRRPRSNDAASGSAAGRWSRQQEPHGPELFCRLARRISRSPLPPITPNGYSRFFTNRLPRGSERVANTHAWPPFAITFRPQAHAASIGLPTHPPGAPLAERASFWSDRPLHPDCRHCLPPPGTRMERDTIRRTDRRPGLLSPIR